MNIASLSLRHPGIAFLAMLSLVMATPGRAGDGQVVHVGEATTLHLDGGGWALDRGASSQTQLVSVQGVGGKRFVVRGVKPGQVKLVFRSGQKTYAAYIDVLK